MLKNRKPFFLLMLLLAGGFAYGTVRLFQLRFDRGDIYPPSSSLRADPLGAKIFYESLNEIPSIEVRRLYEPLPKAGSGADKTLFVLGTGVWSLNSVAKQEAKEIDAFLFAGGRLVISLAPVATKTWSMRRAEKSSEDEKEKAQKAKLRKKKNENFDSDEFEIVSLLDKWHLKPVYDDLEIKDDVALPAVVTRAPDFPALPESLDWHSALGFEITSNHWQTVYWRGTNSVVLERSVGKGSIVLCSDSYLFSNEAMRKDRHAGLLAWMVGDNRTVVFDETHLGVESDPGIAALARKYRLHGLIAGLLLLAGLFVWQNSVSLAPPYEVEHIQGQTAIIAGKDASSGFVNLLRRSIPPPVLLATCVAEWKRAGLHRQDDASSQTIDALVAEETSKPSQKRNLPQTYRNISEVLSQRKIL